MNNIVLFASFDRNENALAQVSPLELSQLKGFSAFNISLNSSASFELLNSEKNHVISSPESKGEQIKCINVAFHSFINV